MSGEVELPPGTEIYGIVYADCSVGGWNADRLVVRKMIRNLRDAGLTPMILIRLRMRTESLWSEP